MTKSYDYCIEITIFLCVAIVNIHGNIVGNLLVGGNFGHFSVSMYCVYIWLCRQAHVFYCHTMKMQHIFSEK